MMMMMMNKEKFLRICENDLTGLYPDIFVWLFTHVPSNR